MAKVTLPQKGGCHCGALRYELSAPRVKAKKTSEEIEREIAEFKARGNEVEQLESFVAQGTRRVGWVWR